jgi:hypothetical protein
MTIGDRPLSTHCGRYWPQIKHLYDVRQLCSCNASRLGECSVMKYVSVAATAFLFASSIPTIATPSASIFQKGREISGTCFAKYRGTVLMNGPCKGLGHGDSLFVTAEKDQCSLDVTRSGEVAISAYRGDCGNSELGSDDEPIGKLKPVGNCLVGPNARVCLKAGRGVVKNAY